MNLGSLKQKTNQFFLKKKVRSLNFTCESSHFKVVKIGVLISEDEGDIDILEDLRTRLRISVADFFVFKLTENEYEDESGYESKLKIHSIRAGNFGWKGGIKGEDLEGLLSNEFDLWFNYDSSGNVFGDVLSLHSIARLKIGVGATNSNIYQLKIESSKKNRLKIVHEEVLKYLKLLNLIQ